MGCAVPCSRPSSSWIPAEVKFEPLSPARRLDSHSTRIATCTLTTLPTNTDALGSSDLRLPIDPDDRSARASLSLPTRHCGMNIQASASVASTYVPSMASSSIFVCSSRRQRRARADSLQIPCRLSLQRRARRRRPRQDAPSRGWTSPQTDVGLTAHSLLPLLSLERLAHGRRVLISLVNVAYARRFVVPLD